VPTVNAPTDTLDARFSAPVEIFKLDPSVTCDTTPAEPYKTPLKVPTVNALTVNEANVGDALVRKSCVVFSVPAENVKLDPSVTADITPAAPYKTPANVPRVNPANVGADEVRKSCVVFSVPAENVRLDPSVTCDMTPADPHKTPANVPTVKVPMVNPANVGADVVRKSCVVSSVLYAPE
jgi:hypothetical protein